MCGIVGVFNLTGESFSHNNIKKMADTIAHRGPDGEGYYVQDNIALAHKRLAILDTSDKGAQPMISRNKEWVFVFNGCIYNVLTPVTITEPNQLALTINSTPLTCASSQGKLDLNVLGGTAPFTYSWSNGATTEDLTGLTSGTYSVIVVDSKNCNSIDSSEIIDNPIVLDLYSQVYYEDYNLTAYHSNDGSVDLTVTGGTYPYLYNWSNGSTTEDIENLASGEYVVYVTDSTGCIDSLSITLKEQLKLIVPTGITPNGDGFNDKFVIVGLNYNDFVNNLIVFNRWGNKVFEVENYQNDWGGTNQKGEDLAEGTYFIILKVSNDILDYNGYLDIRR